MNRLFLCLGAALVIVSGCRPPSGPTPVAERIIIANGTSHGMCAGLCKVDMVIEGTSVQILMQKHGRGAGQPTPDSVVTGTITTSEWNDLVAMSSSMKSLAPGDTVIGCPDCADQGAEYVSVTKGTSGQRATFDAGKKVAPIQPLLDRLRAIRMRIAGR